MNTECIIWTAAGVWLQTRGPEGERRLAGLGRMHSDNVRQFCRERGIEFVEHRPELLERGTRASQVTKKLPDASKLAPAGP